MNLISVLYDPEWRPQPEIPGYCTNCATPMQIQELDGFPRAICPACGFIRWRNPPPTVGLLIINDGRVVLGRRTNEPGPGLWSLPGGYIEYDEDFLSAARREAREETGLAVEIDGIISVLSEFHLIRNFLTIYLLAHPTGGRIVPGDDLTDVDWFPMDEAVQKMGFPTEANLVSGIARGDAIWLPVSQAGG